MNHIDDMDRHAQAYVDRALEAQRRSGIEPHVSDEAYAKAIHQAAEGLASLTDRESPIDEDAVPA